MIAHNHQVVLQVERDPVGIGQLGGIALEHPKRRVIVGGGLAVHDYSGGILNRHVQFLTRFVACDAPGAMRCGEEPVGGNISFRIPGEHRHPILRVVVRDVDVKRLRIDIRPAQHLHAGLVAADNPFRLGESRFGRCVVQPRILHNAKQVFVGHHHHVVLRIDGDGAPRWIRIFDVAQRLPLEIACTRVHLNRCRYARTHLLGHRSPEAQHHQRSDRQNTRNDQPTSFTPESHRNPSSVPHCRTSGQNGK